MERILKGMKTGYPVIRLSGYPVQPKADPPLAETELQAHYKILFCPIKP